MVKKKTKKDNDNIHKEHRERVKKQILNGGYNDATPTHQLMEALLFYAIPRIDTNPLGHELMSRFGSIENVITASKDELLSVPGVGKSTAAFFKLLTLIQRRMALDETEKINYFGDDKAIGEYLVKQFKNIRTERVCILCINAKGKLIRFEVISEGTVARVGIDIRRIVEVAVSSGAAHIILCHNHPGGIAKPSYLDAETTSGLKSSLNSVGIDLTHTVLLACT